MTLEDTFPVELTFDDLLMLPEHSDLTSREEADISAHLGNSNITLKLPVISAPMDKVTEDRMASAMSTNGGMGIIHRYNSIENQCDLVKKVIGIRAAAVGASGDYLERAAELVKSGVSVLCIDVAHGDHSLMRIALETLRAKYPQIHLMAGNVATSDGFSRLSQWGADSIKVGIGSGCFVPGTLVNTESGLKKIEDICVGDKVFSHTGKLQPVVDILAFDRDEEIVSINGIDCTKNHEFYVIDKKNANLVNEDNIHLFARWVHAEELDMEKYLLIELE